MASKEPKSSQLYFFLMPSEIAEMWTFLSEIGCVMYADRSSTAEPRGCELSADVSKFFICPRELESDVRMRRVSESWFFIDETISPVIECSCSVLRGNALSRGRLFFRGGYEGREGWVGYPAILRDAYKQTTSFLRAEILTKRKEYLGYLSKGSQLFLDNGGALCQF